MEPRVAAELVVRHTRRHMPTRRVALGRAYLPTNEQATGALLIGALVAEHRDALDDDQLEALPKLLHEARDGIVVPRIALRHRLQTDVHGLDSSRHRLLVEGAATIIELDTHGARVPQVVGAIMGAAQLQSTHRRRVMRVIELAVDGRFYIPAAVQFRRLANGIGHLPPPRPGAPWKHGAPAREVEWDAVPSERRWAMEVLGLRPGAALVRGEINRRFRRLVRDAHPDHGAARDIASERIAELSEARALLLAVASVGPDGDG